AATNREQWLRRFYTVGEEAGRPRRPGELYGFLIQPSRTSEALLNILRKGGGRGLPGKQRNVFQVGNPPPPNDPQPIRMDQPYGAFAKSLLEVQHYPNLRDSEGHPIAPYDVTAHTLPLLMNVDVYPVKAPPQYSKPTPGDVFQLTETTVDITPPNLFA